MEYLIFGLQDKLKSSTHFDLADGDFFTKIYREISRASDSWVINSANLLNMNHWNLPSLKSKRELFNGEYEEYIRKPRVNLYLNVTQKGNLILEWKPTEHGPRHQNLADFKTFHNGRTGDWSDPWNRIFIIRDYITLTSMALSETDSNSYYCLVKAIIELVQTIKRSLKVNIDVSLINQLVIEYDSPSFSFDSKPVDISIETTENINKARLKIKAEKWEKEKLIQGLGLTALSFGALFIENDRDIPKMVKSLKNIVKTGAVLNKQKINGYLNKLSELFPDEFGRILNIDVLSAKVVELYPQS